MWKHSILTTFSPRCTKTARMRSSGRLRVGSLISGYGGLDLAVEQVFEACAVWFSDINEPVARVFAHHWSHAQDLGDITAIDWSSVQPVDVLCGGFPGQDVSTVGKRAGFAPGTRSGLWRLMATAGDALQPEWVVIQNVRGLLSAPATRPSPEGDDNERRNHDPATPEDATPGNVEPDPVASEKSADSTSTGSRSRTCGFGQPRVRRTMGRPTRSRCRRTISPVPYFHPRPAHCSEPRSLQTPHAGGESLDQMRV